jgi:hypothetical protein
MLHASRVVRSSAALVVLAYLASLPILANAADPCARVCAGLSREAGEHRGCDGPTIGACGCRVDPAEAPAAPLASDHRLAGGSSISLAPEAALVGVVPAAATARLSAWPRHGHHPPDLQALLSVFLI